MTLKQLDKWHQTKTGFAVFGLVELGLAYLFASLAINSGSIWQWLLAFIFLLGTVQNIIKFVRTFVHGKI